MATEVGPPLCPGCGRPGRPIADRTVIAVTAAPLAARQAFHLCATPECELVYYGDAGARVPAEALRLRPTWKGGDVLCFCFGHRVGDSRDVRHLDGKADLVEQISMRVAAGDCACDLRNPSGRCCLQEIRRTVSVEAGPATKAGS